MQHHSGGGSGGPTLMALSVPAEATQVPSGWKATVFTYPLWSSYTRRHCRVATSQMRTVLSSLPEAARRPSGLKQQLLTQLLWPEKVNWNLWPGTDHTCTSHNSLHRNVTFFMVPGMPMNQTVGLCLPGLITALGMTRFADVMCSCMVPSISQSPKSKS